jgi:hypothetical protein
MLTNKYKQEVNEIYKRYPLIQSLGGWDTKTVAKALGEYINLIDSVKGV